MSRSRVAFVHDLEEIIRQRGPSQLMLICSEITFEYALEVADEMKRGRRKPDRRITGALYSSSREMNMLAASLKREGL